VNGSPVPVVIAGGEKTDSRRELLKMVNDSVSAGGCGISIGRNVFQAKQPTRMVRALSEIVHERISIDQAEAILDGNQ